MKKLFIAIAIATILGQFLGSLVTRCEPQKREIAKNEPNKGLRYLPFFSYI